MTATLTRERRAVRARDLGFLLASLVLHASAVAWLPRSSEPPAPPEVIEVALVRAEPPPVRPEPPPPRAEPARSVSPSPRRSAAPEPPKPPPPPPKSAERAQPQPPAPAPRQEVLALLPQPREQPILTVPQGDPAPRGSVPEPATEAAPSAAGRSTAAPKGEPGGEKSAAATPPSFNAAYLRNPAPRYPMMARRNGEQGTVMLRVLVTREGAAATVNVEKTSGSTALDQAAVEAVRNWRFVPARQGGQSVEAWVLVPIVFKLEGAS